MLGMKPLVYNVLAATPLEDVTLFIGREEIPSPKVVKTFPGPIRSFTVEDNHIGSAVSKILRYIQKKAYYFI